MVCRTAFLGRASHDVAQVVEEMGGALVPADQPRSLTPNPREGLGKGGSHVVYTTRGSWGCLPQHENVVATRDLRPPDLKGNTTL